MKSKLFICLFLFSFLFFSRVQAFSVLPAKILITTEKNNSELVQLKIINNEEQLNNFQIEVFDIEQKNDGSLELIFNRDLEKWLTPVVKNITLSAGEEKVIDFDLKISEDLYPGSHFFALSISKITNENLKTQIVSLLNLEVAGTAVEQMKIEKFFIDTKINFKKDLNFYLAFKNLSNVAVPLKGELKIKNIFGKNKFSKEISLGNKLLVNSSRNLDLIVAKKDNKIFWPGIYKSELNIFYGKTGQTLTSEIVFFYLPIWAFLSLSIILLIVLLFVRRKKKYEK